MQLIRLPDVLKMVPVGKTTWYALVKENDAPQPVKLGPRTSAWLKSDIEEWIRKRQGTANNMTSLQ
ncbi:helix-turn-helix transcriptional regulator [Arsukibacterium sp.]|uniref:helix-turn-helix transcriptional regulator n=1 Tax=Arsukibacterium sp. TaxID=1977258 RepID=UPI002FDAC471